MCSCDCGRDLTRREFLANSTLAAVAAVLASACGDGQIGGLGPSDPGAGLDSFVFQPSDYPELGSVGGIAVIRDAPIPMAVVRTGQTGYDVFSLICPHAGTTVSPAGQGFKCPNHGATWNQQGAWIGGWKTTDLVQLQATFDAAAGSLTVKGSAGNVDLTVRLASYAALVAVGGLARVDGNSKLPIGVARTGPESFVAYGLACPHEQYTIDPVGNGWRCPAHGARFAADGALLEGPAVVGLTALKATYDPRAGTIRIRGSAIEGKIWTDDD